MPFRGPKSSPTAIIITIIIIVIIITNNSYTLGFYFLDPVRALGLELSLSNTVLSGPS